MSLLPAFTTLSLFASVHSAGKINVSPFLNCIGESKCAKNFVDYLLDLHHLDMSSMQIDDEAYLGYYVWYLPLLSTAKKAVSVTHLTTRLSTRLAIEMDMSAR